MIGYADATPGTVTQEQVSTGLIVRPTDTQSPTIVDQTMDTIDGTEDLTIAATITDDQLVRTVELTYSNDVDETATTLQLTNAGDDLVLLDHRQARAAREAQALIEDRFGYAA